MAQLACKALLKNIENRGNFAKNYQHILVDEFQDINLAQKTLVDAFFKAGAQLWAWATIYNLWLAWKQSEIHVEL